jgi:hypothetical protein
VRLSLAAAIAAAAVLAAGCGHAAQHVSAPATSPAARAATVPAAAVPATPPAAGPRLTIKQAAAAYVRIIDPANRLAAIAGSDITDAAPFSQYQADARAFIRAIRAGDRQLRAIRWPARVQPYITAMLLTFEPADIRCARAEVASGSSDAASTTGYTDQDCIDAGNSTIPDTIRTMLRLPPRG